MSFVKLFKNAKVASIVCSKNTDTDKYDCKMGFDLEGNLIKNNGFKHNQSFCDSELHSFIESLGAVDTKNVTDVRRWVVVKESDNKSITDIYSFGGSSEVHITKVPNK